MPLHKKKFIDKKKSITFRLVHRSQKDPLVADEDAPQHVLLKYGKQNQVQSDKRIEEQRKFGIYYDDDYNYLQHLRDVKTITEWHAVTNDHSGETSNSGETQEVHKEKFSLNLPSSVFQSCVEEDEGLLHKAAPDTGPKVNWDPDIVAALDDDFDFKSDNELEDDFIALANQQDDKEEDFSSDDNEEGEEDDNYDDLSDDSLESEEGNNRFTNYSMSSSVLPRSKNLQDVDDHFEKFLEKYDEDGFGALDCDEIQGYVKPDSELVQQLANKYAEEQNNRTLKDIILSNLNVKVSKENANSSSDEELMEVTIHEKPAENWDCESILSTYSTTSNRPKVIEEPRKRPPRIQVSNSSGLPEDTLRTKGLTAASLRILDQSLNDSSKVDSVCSRSVVSCAPRNKNETAEEKRERKAIVKQMRKERRTEKKANQLAFKKEEQRQEKVMINLKQNLNGIKLL